MDEAFVPHKHLTFRNLFIGFSILLLGLIGGGLVVVYSRSFSNESSTLSPVNDTQRIKSLYIIKPEGVYYQNQLMNAADPKTFIILGWAFAKDANYAYYGNSIIEGADTITFSVLPTEVFLADTGGVSELYTKDKNHVYFSSPEGGTWVLENADPLTFKVLGQIGNGSAEWSYAKDANHVWHVTSVVSNADIESFTMEFDGNGYDAQDKNHKYLNGEIVSATSTVLKDWQGWKWYPLDTIFRSGENFFPDYYNAYRNIDGTVYYIPGDARAFQKISEADASTFQFAYVETSGGVIIKNQPNLGGVVLNFGKDKNNAFWEYLILPGADPTSFEPLFDLDGNLTHFSKDTWKVFYENQLISGADPAAFVVVENGYANPYSVSRVGYDRSHVYFMNILISVADAPTFSFVGNSVKSIFLVGTYYKDKNRVYWIATESDTANLVEGADPPTFVITPKQSVYDAQDKSHKYLQGKIVQ